jgi:hypothetical protein
MSEEKKPPLDRMVEAYETMLERVDGLLSKAEGSTIPSLRESVRIAREKAVELNELSREEAERIATYLERDMQDAATFLSDTGREFRGWLRFETEVIENRLLELFIGVADRTVVELEQLAERARAASSYHTGEVTGPGTLVCTQCGKVMHFHQTGHIPPCGGCRGTSFRRQFDEEEGGDSS